MASRNSTPPPRRFLFWPASAPRLPAAIDSPPPRKSALVALEFVAAPPLSSPPRCGGFLEFPPFPNRVVHRYDLLDFEEGLDSPWDTPCALRLRVDQALPFGFVRRERWLWQSNFRTAARKFSFAVASFISHQCGALPTSAAEAVFSLVPIRYQSPLPCHFGTAAQTAISAIPPLAFLPSFFCGTSVLPFCRTVRVRSRYRFFCSPHLHCSYRERSMFRAM